MLWSFSKVCAYGLHTYGGYYVYSLASSIFCTLVIISRSLIRCRFDFFFNKISSQVVVSTLIRRYVRSELSVFLSGYQLLMSIALIYYLKLQNGKVVIFSSKNNKKFYDFFNSLFIYELQIFYKEKLFLNQFSK